MKYAYKIQDLCCASCGAKIERALQKRSDMSQVTVNVMTQRLSFESALPREEMPGLEQEIQRIIQKYEPDCRLLAE